MVKGKVIPSDYNEFEEEVNEIAGHFTMLYGLDYDLYKLYRTFQKAEGHLINEAVRYAKQFNKEDEEVKHSIISGDPDHEIKYSPPIDKLKKSYFITIHSVATDVLEDIFSLTKKYHLSHIKALNYKCLKESIDARFPLDRAILKHDVIVWYNLVRNKIVHPKTCHKNEYQNLINKGEGAQKWLKIDQVGDRIHIEIIDMEFGYEYAKRIMLFLRDVVDESYRDRKKK
jgi:hypothetical protein